MKKITIMAKFNEFNLYFKIRGMRKMYYLKF